MKPASPIILREFPYPYRAALALCSDIDLCPRATFIEIHRQINCPRHGLGLPVSDSFFGCAAASPQLAYLDETGAESPDAGFIRDAIQAGLIDTLHTWIDFNDRPADAALNRRLAKALVNDLQRHGLSVPVWTNHGSPANVQNVRCRLYPHFKGDDPADQFYTADLLGGLGVRYLWLMENVGHPLSVRSTYGRSRAMIRSALNSGKNCLKILGGRMHQLRPASYLKRLTHTVRLRNGGIYHGFVRCNSHPLGVWTPRPTRRTLRDVLTPWFLDSLSRDRGYAIIYTHLGLPVWKVSEEPLFAPPDILALESLAVRYQAGEIWVAPTAQLLEYHRVRTTLKWTARESGARTIIDLLSCRGHDGMERPVSPDECAGLTFFVPGPGQTDIRIGNSNLHVTDFPADRSGRVSAGFAIVRPPDTEVLEAA